MKCEFSEQVLFLGLGQCGNNISYEFHKTGYDCFLINSTKDDLKPFVDLRDEFKFHLGGGIGSKKDPRISEQLCLENFDKIKNIFKNKFTSCKFCFITFSMDGGTGGSAVVLGNALAKSFPDITFIFQAIAPNYKRGHHSKHNALVCFNKLNKISETNNVIIWDNNANESLEDMNQHIVQRIDDLLSLNIYPNAKGNIDVAEIQHMLKTAGSTFMFDINQSLTSQNPIQADKYFVTPITGTVYSTIAYSLKSDDDLILKEVENAYGQSRNDYFKGYNPVKSFAVICGAPLGNTYFSKLKQMYDMEEQKLASAYVPNKTMFDVGEFEETPNKPQQQPIEDSSVESLFKL